MMQDEQQSPAEVSIRRAGRDDYAAFCRLFPELLVDDPVPGLDAWTSVLSASTWLATVDGEVLGYCYVQEYVETGYVRHVVVSPTARKRGLGRALMCSAAESLRSHGKRSWRLNVRPSNQAARALYDRLGLHEKYLAHALRLQWSALTALPAGNGSSVPASPTRLS
jgi:[ribosomal protein S18]-alanine N-acetyltransferase